MNGPIDPLPVRFYRLALVVLPRRFRRSCGAAMVAMVADEWRERRGIRRGTLLATALLDLVWTAIIERIRPLGGPTHQATGEERVRNSRRGGRISWLDVKLGLRMMLKYPGLSLVAGFGMAAAIALGAGWFGYLHGFMDPKLPLDEGERVVSIRNREVGARPSVDDMVFEDVNPDRHSLHDFFEWRAEVRSVRDLGASRTVTRNLILGDGATALVRVAEMSAAGFRVARIPPVLGRPLLDGDERPGAPPVVVIGYGEWQRRFGGDQGVLGQELRLGRDVHTVVGVMPEGYRFPVNHSYWVPLRLNPLAYERGRAPTVHVFGRLADGVSMERAQAELTTIGDRMAAAFPESHGSLRPRVMPYVYGFTALGEGPKPLEFYLLQNAYLLLLVLVAVNVAILIYARTAARSGEIAVRTALGASRGRVVTQLFMEALVLALAASAVGLIAARTVLGLVFRFQQQDQNGLPFWMDDFGLSLEVVAYGVGMAVLAAVLAGVLPALKVTGRRVQPVLQDFSSSGSRMQLGPTWTALIVVQVALAVAVLPYSAYFAGQATLTGSGETPFPADELLRARLSMERQDAPWQADSASSERASEARFQARTRELVRRLEAEPGVAGVTLATHYPGNGPYRLIELEAGSSGVDPSGPASPPTSEAPDPQGFRRTRARVHEVGTDLFSVFGLPMLAGRGFHAGGDDGDARTVVVNRTLAEWIGARGPVFGRRLRIHRRSGGAGADTEAGPWLEIVGVVPDFAIPNDFGPMATLFTPMAAGAAPGVTLAVRVRGGGSATELAGILRRTAAAVDPALQLHELRSVGYSRRQELLAFRLLALAIGAVMLSVLLLSAAGIYAMMSFTVARRRREIGIRAALGADARHILGGVFARAASQLGAGALGGIVLGAALQVAAGSLPGVMLPAVAAGMVAVGLLAALGPARRGLAVQPSEALREE